MSTAGKKNTSTDDGKLTIRNRLRVLFSRKSDEWSTPQWLIDFLRMEFLFTLDPCADQSNFKCSKYFTKDDDGLAQDWGTECVFMNPPYSQIALWLKKAYDSARAGATVVSLIPSRTDTLRVFARNCRGSAAMFGRFVGKIGEWNTRANQPTRGAAISRLCVR